MQKGWYSIILAVRTIPLDLREKKTKQNDIPRNTPELSFQSLNTTVTFPPPQWHSDGIRPILHNSSMDVLIITLRKASHHTLRQSE